MSKKGGDIAQCSVSKIKITQKQISKFCMSGNAYSLCQRDNTKNRQKQIHTYALNLVFHNRIYVKSLYFQEENTEIHMLT